METIWHQPYGVQCIGCGTPVMLLPGTVSLGVPLHCPLYPGCSRPGAHQMQRMGSTLQNVATPQYQVPPRAFSAPNTPLTVQQLAAYQTAQVWPVTGAVTTGRPHVPPLSLFPADKYRYDLVESLLVESPSAESPPGPAAAKGHGHPAPGPLTRSFSRAAAPGHGHENGQSVQPNQHAAAAMAAAAAMYGTVPLGTMVPATMEHGNGDAAAAAAMYGMSGTLVPATMEHGNTGGGASGPDLNAFGRMMSMDPADDDVAPAPVAPSDTSSATGSMHGVPWASFGEALAVAPAATASPANQMGLIQQTLPVASPADSHPRPLSLPV